MTLTFLNVLTGISYIATVFIAENLGKSVRCVVCQGAAAIGSSYWRPPV